MDFEIDKIEGIRPKAPLDLYAVYEIMTSSRVTNDQKVQFIKNNNAEIKSLTDQKISGLDFQMIMESRPLELFKPIKNKCTKLGDRKLLAMALGIKPIQVDSYVRDVTLKISSMEDLKALGISRETYEEIKTYVYRYGTKEQVITHLDYELNHAKNVVESLYHTLQYNAGGVADYFIHPIHKLDNDTIAKMYNTIDKNLTSSREAGNISEAHKMEASEWALKRIYEIQNNQHLKNAIELKKKLS